MASRSHPLNALRAFETSARHLSFVKASEELYVTPAAVSHQVKRLEAYLGLPLFRRLPKGLVLTEAGQILGAELRDVFARLDRAVERVERSERRGALTISVAPMFATKWLVPRLESFRAQAPDIDVRVSSSLDLVDFQREDFDAAIRVGEGRYPGLLAVQLFAESVAPMCSPRLRRGARALRRPTDLRRHTLLHDDSMRFDPAAPTWASWLATAGVRGFDTTRGPRFNQPDHALQAAIDGAGVVLGWRQLAAADLAAGRLVAPFDPVVPLGSAFYLVYPPGYEERAKVARFRDWLIAETRRATDAAAT